MKSTVKKQLAEMNNELNDLTEKYERLLGGRVMIRKLVKYSVEYALLNLMPDE